MNILAIDPGTKCGYAMGPALSGVWNLSIKPGEGAGMRFFRLRNYLVECCRDVDMVVYEDVARHLGTQAAHIYGGIVAHIQEYCEMNHTHYVGVPVKTIKLFATGKGNADKAAMIAAARERWPEYDLKDDNQVDALWIWAWATEEYS